MTHLMSRVRCFLSWLIFEKIRGWPKPTPKALEIIKKNDDYNHGQERHCHSCLGKNIVSDCSGSSGPFSWPHHFYRCRDCGNAQDDSGIHYIWEYEALERKRITEDNGKYRYIIFTEGYQFLLWILSLFLAIGGSSYGIGFFEGAILYKFIIVIFSYFPLSLFFIDFAT